MTFGQELMKTAIASARGGRIIAIRTMDFPKMLTLLPGMIFFSTTLEFCRRFLQSDFMQYEYNNYYRDNYDWAKLPMHVEEETLTHREDIIVWSIKEISNVAENIYRPGIGDTLPGRRCRYEFSYQGKEYVAPTCEYCPSGEITAGDNGVSCNRIKS